MNEKSPMTDNEYRKADGARCPICRSEETEGSSIQIDADYAVQECGCNDCHAEWNSLYTLTGYDNLVNGKGEKVLNPSNAETEDLEGPTAKAARAQQIIDLYAQKTGSDLDSVLGDLLADLMHWAAHNNYDYELAHVRAEGHFSEEVLEAQALSQESAQ